MAHHVQEVQLHIPAGDDHQEAAATPSSNYQIQRKRRTFKKIKHLKWWFMVALNIIFLLCGQTTATLLGRLYYDKGGNSLWMATIVQSAGFPILFIAYFFYASSTHKSPVKNNSTSRLPGLSKIIISIYIGLGIIIAGDNLMYSYGLLYLPVSTYSLICASQLAFNAVFSYFFNSQKLTPLIFNSVILLTFSAALLGVRPGSDESGSDIPEGKYPLGFVLTLAASATFSLILSLMQLTFQKVLKKETFSIVLELQICTSFVATCCSVIGLFASGEWRGLKGEIEGYEKGRVSYVMTLVWIAVAWQVASVGIVGLIFVVSSLFSNVISTLASPMVPIFAVIFFHDRMDGVKIMAMLIAIWGFFSYIYQQYLDDLNSKKAASSSSSSSSSILKDEDGEAANGVEMSSAST